MSELETTETRKFPVPPERIIYRPMGLSVTRTDDGETVVTFLVTPTKFVLVELPPEAHQHLLTSLSGGIVVANQMPGGAL